MGRLFGTDGARGVANTELGCELALNIGRAAAMILTKNDKHPTILIGMDTRVSSDMLAAAMTAGLISVGANVMNIGVVPTPAVAFLVEKYGCSAGVMISASHNPCEYNGIKLFDGHGYKLPDMVEEEIEAIVLDKAEQPPVPTGGELGRIIPSPDAIADYIDHLCETVETRFEGLKIAIDCANGSSSVTAEKLFTRLGAECIMLSAAPDGVNINKNCGSTHMGELCRQVKQHGCDLGLAFDGDADRCLAVDGGGELVDGDQMMAIFAKEMKANGRLKENSLVVTVMSNLGLFHFARDNGITAVKTKVGDRYVLEEMRLNGYVLGGEQSGHLIFTDFATTGDGQLSAVQLLATIKRTGASLKELASCMQVFPQTLVNITVNNEAKARLEIDNEVRAAVRRAQEELADDGRVLVRPSGTEPLVRVMVEGKVQADIERIANDVADTIKERLA